MAYYRLLALALAFVFTSCDKEDIVNTDDLPGDATSFVSTHYPDQQILRVIKERDDLKVTYYVYLDNGTKLEFTKSGELKEIEGSERIPDSILPALVLDYVNDNYPGAFIRCWDPEGSTHEARLSNGLELVFDKYGNFLRIED